MFRDSNLEIAQGIAHDYGYRLAIRGGEIVTRQHGESRKRIHPSLADAIATMVSESTGISKSIALASYEDL